MTEKPAKGVRGFLLNQGTERYYFRVYREDYDEYGHREFDDYQLRAEDIEVTIGSSVISLYEHEGTKWLDWSSKISSSGSIPPKVEGE